MAFLVLPDSTQLTGLKPAPQVVACPTNRENWGRQSDNMTSRKAGGRRTDSSTSREENGRRTDGVGRGYVEVTTP